MLGCVLVRASGGGVATAVAGEGCPLSIKFDEFLRPIMLHRLLLPFGFAVTLDAGVGDAGLAVESLVPPMIPPVGVVIADDTDDEPHWKPASDPLFSVEAAASVAASGPKGIDAGVGLGYASASLRNGGQ